MSSNHLPTPVVVGIITYRRPVGLARLLSSLERIEPPEPPLDWAATLVVDNSPDAEAKNAIPPTIAGRPVIYRHEPEPGISAARNAVVDAAYPQMVAFIDDDEVASPQWLSELTRVWGKHPNAGAVVGRVRYQLPDDAPRSAIASGVFDEMSLVEGEAPEYFATGNLLLRTTLRDDFGTLFDPAFGLLGGGDGHLGERLRRGGIAIVSAPSSVATETVTTDRLSNRWLRNRLERKGGTMLLVEMSLASGPLSVVAIAARFCLKAVGRIAFGLMVATADIARGEPAWRGRRQIHLGVGHLRALGRVPAADYRRHASHPVATASEAKGRQQYGESNPTVSSGEVA